ncbi:MAG: hypothetical protein PHE55_18540 [Methylococcaceae bacterium]|nr:hypothetical protein [Methylococcaceae bacterium]
MKRLPRLLLLIFLLANLNACVWLRLLELKSQLAEFDENFKTEASDHFTLRFKNPVLLSDDFVELAKLQPTRKEPTPTGSRWIQTFHKIDAHGKTQPGIDFYFTLDFNQDEQLTSWDFSRLFMAMVPAQFFEASIRSLGKGKVDESKHQFKVEEKDLARITVKPPTLEKIIADLGQPAVTTQEQGKKLLIYRFQVDSPWIDEDHQDRRITEAKLYFDPKSEELTEMGGKFIGLKISIDLLKLGEQGKHENTAAKAP